MAREGTTAAKSVAPSTEEVWAEIEVAVEPEQSTAALVAPLAGVSLTQSSSSFSALSNVGPPIGDQEKALMTSTEDAASEGHTVHFNLVVPGDESVLVNPILAKRLLHTTILPTNWESRRKRTVAEMFSSFYLIILGASYFLSFFLLI